MHTTTNTPALSTRIAHVDALDDIDLRHLIDWLDRTELDSARDQWLVPTAIVAARRGLA